MTVRMNAVCAIALFIALSRPAAAQTPKNAVTDVIATAETLTPELYARYLAELGADSLQGRRAPGAELERTARYVAAQFQGIGVAPLRLLGDPPNGRDSATYFQRYPTPHRPVEIDGSSRLVFSYGPRHANNPVVTDRGQAVERRVFLSLGTTVRFVVPRVPERKFTPQHAVPVVLLTGRPSAAFLRSADIASKAVLYLPPAGIDSVEQHAILGTLYQETRGAVLLTAESSDRFMAEPIASRRRSLRLEDAYLRDRDAGAAPISVTAAPIAALSDLLDAFGVDTVSARTVQAPVIRPLPGLTVWLEHRWISDSTTTTTVPNVIGLIEGTTPYHCVVITAPLDQRQGPGARDASTASLAALLSVAEALARLPTRPTYSVLLLATAGAASDQAFWGSHYFANNVGELAGSCGFRRPRIVLALDLRAWSPTDQARARGTVAIAGLTDVTLPVALPWIASRHPELEVTVMDGGSIVDSPSDAAVFARRAYPSLAFEAKVDAAADPVYGARLFRFFLYVAHELANATPLPRWTADGLNRLFRQP